MPRVTKVEDRQAELVRAIAIEVLRQTAAAAILG